MTFRQSMRLLTLVGGMCAFVGYMITRDQHLANLTILNAIIAGWDYD